MLMSLKIPPPSTIRKIRKLKKIIKKKLNGYKVFHDCSDREKKLKLNHNITLLEMWTQHHSRGDVNATSL